MAEKRILETERLYLREMTSSDFPSLCKILQDEKAMYAYEGALNDEEAQELYRELISVSTRYMSFRSNWLLWSREEKMEKDSARTSCHDSVIVKFNMLERFLKVKGKEARWREVLGYEENDFNLRKRIGDFACYMVFVNSLLAR